MQDKILILLLHTERSVLNKKTMNTTKRIQLLLFLSAVNLTLMIPGGFIESRDFSHISAATLGIFNSFLTLLGIVSLFLIYCIGKQWKWAYKGAYICGISYFIVYTIDLLAIFPQSPTAMPTLLFNLEFLGTVLSIPLFLYAVRKARRLQNTPNQQQFSRSMYGFIGVAIVVGLGIIIFATTAAMTAK